MGEFRFSSWIIGLIFASFISVAFGVMITGFNEAYSIDSDFNETEFNQYDKIQELNLLAEKVQQEGLNSSLKDPGFLDIVGSYISAGFSTMTLAFTSLDEFKDMAGYGVDALGIGVLTAPLKQTIIGSMIILIVIGVIVASYMKWRT